MGTKREVFTWVNPSTGALNPSFRVSFNPTSCTITNTSNGNVFQWVTGMAQGSYQQIAGAATFTGGIQTSNGFQVVNTGALYGAPMVEIGINAGSQISVYYARLLGFQVGDIVELGGVIISYSGNSNFNPNGIPLVVSSITYGNPSTVNNPDVLTVSNLSGQSTPNLGNIVYENGGMLFRVKDSAGNIVPRTNHGGHIVEVGSAVQGSSGNNMTLVIEGVDF